MIYDVFTLGTTSKYVTFNDDTNPDYYIRAKKRYISDRDIRQFDSVVPDEMGIVDYQTLVGRSHLIIEAKIYPVIDESGVYGAMEDLREVCNPKLAQEDNDSDDGYIYLKWSEGSLLKQLKVKPLRVDIPETDKGSHTPSVRILCKIKYPVIESQTLKSSNNTITITSGTGIEIPSTGLVIPVGGVTIGADTGTGTSGVINSGDYKAYPNIILTGPINIPKITNATLGKYIEFNYNLAAGEKIYLYIDYDGVTAEHSNGTNMFQYITSGSDIDNFYIRKGQNNITLTATTLGSDCSYEITWRDSWPLS